MDPGDPMPVTIEGSQNKNEIRGEITRGNSTVFFHGVGSGKRCFAKQHVHKWKKKDVRDFLGG